MASQLTTDEAKLQARVVLVTNSHDTIKLLQSVAGSHRKIQSEQKNSDNHFSSVGHHQKFPYADSQQKRIQLNFLAKKITLSAQYFIEFAASIPISFSQLKFYFWEKPKSFIGPGFVLQTIYELTHVSE